MNPLRLAVTRDLRKDAAAFRRSADRMAVKMTADGIHDLRVLVRRIRAKVWIARQLSRGLGRLRDELRDLGHALGERRLLDVAAIDAKSFGIDATPLGTRIAEAGDVVVRRLETRDRLAHRIADAAARVSASGEDRLAKAIQSRAKRLKKAASRAGRGPAELHRLRIEAKKVRYLLDALGLDGSFIKPLQDRIGRAHDLEVLRGLLGPNARAETVERRERAAAYRLLPIIVERALRRLNEATI
jgi:CHAD domain-containing protein